MATGDAFLQDAASCPQCQAVLSATDPLWRLRVCPRCGHHRTLTAADRLVSLVDTDSFVESSHALVSADPLTFADTRPYPDRLAEARERTGLPEAVITGQARIGGHACILIVCDFNFLGGSMGSVVGEKVALALEAAADRKIPCLAICASGGARMQEGMLSLVQMAKTSAAAVRLHQAKVAFISVLTNPTTGGVYASFATQADIILAEPGALVGFAGPRVVEQTTGERLPPGSHTAEFVLEHGQIDAIVPRQRLRGTLATLLGLVTGGRAPVPPVHEPPPIAGDGSPSAWSIVQLARHADRPTTADYLRELMPNFVELHGDRTHGDDSAIVGGLGSLDGVPLVVIGQERGHGDPTRRGGRAHPEGYRKAVRLMRLAAHLRLPLLTLIDTPGAYPGLVAEERNLAGALSQALGTLSVLPTPVVSVVIGEGGSGGALALGLADRIYMLENAIYAVIAPEGAAVILYRDADKAESIAASLKLTAHDCLALGVVDAIIPEPDGGAHLDPRYAALQVKAAVLEALGELQPYGERRLLEERYRKFRRMGQQTADARAVVAREIAELQQQIARRVGESEARARELGERAGEWQHLLSRRLGEWWTLRPRFGAAAPDEGDRPSDEPKATEGQP